MAGVSLFFWGVSVCYWVVLGEQIARMVFGSGYYFAWDPFKPTLMTVLSYLVDETYVSDKHRIDVGDSMGKV